MFCRVTFPLTYLSLSEVMLYVLISGFILELSDKPIEWNVAAVWFPTVGKLSNKPQLPLMVQAYKAS